jgi:hypothetical protein
MVFWSPGEVCPPNFLKHVMFAFEYAYNCALGIAPYVDRNAHGPALSGRKVHPEDATLTTIEMPIIQNWYCAIRSKQRDGGRYIFRMEWHPMA